ECSGLRNLSGAGHDSGGVPPRRLSGVSPDRQVSSQIKQLVRVERPQSASPTDRRSGPAFESLRTAGQSANRNKVRRIGDRSLPAPPTSRLRRNAAPRAGG